MQQNIYKLNILKLKVYKLKLHKTTYDNDLHSFEVPIKGIRAQLTL